MPVLFQSKRTLVLALCTLCLGVVCTLLILNRDYLYVSLYATGVIKHTEKASDDYVLFTANRKTKIIDKSGRLIAAYPGGDAALSHRGTMVVLGGGLEEYTLDGKLLRRHTTRCIHHDYEILEDGSAFYLCRRTKRDLRIAADLSLDENIIFLDKEWKTATRWSLNDHLDEIEALTSLQFPLPVKVAEAHNVTKRWANKVPIVDWAHMNNVEVIPANDWGDPRFKQGNLIISLAEANLLLAVDWPTGEVVWAWGQAILDRQHDPHFLDGPHLSIFNNNTTTGNSEVLTLNLLTGEITDRLSTEEVPFYTPTSGSARRCSNGNTLVSLADYGEIIELAPSGEVVWQYRNPKIDELPLVQRFSFNRIRQAEPKELKVKRQLRKAIKIYRAAVIPRVLFDDLAARKAVSH